MGLWKKLVSVARDFNSTCDEEKERLDQLYRKTHPVNPRCRQCKYFVDGSEPFCRNEYNAYWDSYLCVTVHPDISDPDHQTCSNFKYGQG